ncbi:MAG TPA: hypothetical protein VN612_07665 [Acidobacteriaceae bacterium]|nr:hypothetical protein [Acidobacteriaceae bacterium]
MSDSLQASAAARAADTLLRACGARTILLRMPAPALAGDVTEQLGIATPQFQDIAVYPAAFRKARAQATASGPVRWELMVSATAVTSIVTSLAYASASVLFSNAAGVLVDDELLEIFSATEEQVFGQPYVYRLVLLAPLEQKT